ncbi:conserved Plasmodium membrane protein, unknown function [Plasmodium relictum]|uniref:THH1/TOM1/TOM3 domain-containing protein n=1 Tax=Plasmodium relictum TaxID=85471 RepID=A0A1J1H335_PLARL|nr:conserved Plasmodium membrane protein, unknown function [Plasmodium relictum]CRG99293.1 conserved Plasmodium membrane protein, unknown function [Plasmodium relictum]
MTIGIYLLILLIFFYIYLSCLLYKLLIRNKKISPIASANLTGEKTRLFLFNFFFFCHISRIISLIILTFLDIKYNSIDYNTLLLFPNFYFYLILLKTFPTYFFLSSFTIIIVFWSQVYYASILVSFPYLQPLYIFLNILVYTINIVLASLTFFMKTFTDYIYYNYILESIIDYLIAIGFIYYGIKVTKKLKEKSKGISRKKSIIRRILSLSVILFIILSLKGLYSFWCFFSDSNFYNSYLDLPTSDAIIYFISECIPSLLIISTFQPNKEKNTLNIQYTTPLCSETFDPYNFELKKKKKSQNKR